MEAYKCDLCGALYENDDHEDGSLIVKCIGRTMDFCPDCYKALKNFMKPKEQPSWERVCANCKHQNTPSTHHPCYSCSMRFPTFDNWEAMDGED